MADHNHIKLTSSELAAYFGSYLNDSVTVCMMSYFLEHVEDPDVEACVKYSLELSQFHLELDRKLFSNEGIAQPAGFTAEDVNVKAERLFPDEVMLHYIVNIGLIGMNAYSSALAASSRPDIREHFTSCLYSSAELYNRTTTVMQEKGIYVRAPHIPYPSDTKWVDSKHFLAGWFGEQRPLTSIEISNLFMNRYRNALGKCLLTGFAQTTKDKTVSEFLYEGITISNHALEIFSNLLIDDHLPVPSTGVIMPTASTESVFSDKLLMYHTIALIGSGMGYYGMSMGVSLRRDLAAAYSRMILEAGKYADSGAKIMIEHGWMEMPPSAPDRNKLIKD